MTKLCSIPECGKPSRNRGWCWMHYNRWRRNGDANLTQVTPKGTPLKWIFEHSSHQGDQCLIWPFSRGGSGYASKVTYLGKKTGPNRVMCSLANGPPPSPNLDAAHSCGKGHLGCINPKHLSWKTRKENVEDQIIHGTKLFGESTSKAKLTEDEVLKIRRLYAAGNRPMSYLAVSFGVTKLTIFKIIHRKTWPHI